MQPMANETSHGRDTVSSNTIVLSAIMKAALHLARRLTRPPWAQLRNKGPNRRWFHSQRYKRGELRAAAQAAIRMKTVVGRPGTITPIAPMTRHSTANACSNQRTGHGKGRSAGGVVASSSGGWESMERIVNRLVGEPSVFARYAAFAGGVCVRQTIQTHDDPHHPQDGRPALAACGPARDRF